MHLVTFVELTKPSPVIRVMVMLAQGVAMNALFLLYLVAPRALHRFVGYLEEEVRGGARVGEELTRRLPIRLLKSRWLFISTRMRPLLPHTYCSSQACHTYTCAIKDLDDGKLPLWSNAPAPQIAVTYWRPPSDAKLRDVLLAVRAGALSASAKGCTRRGCSGCMRGSSTLPRARRRETHRIVPLLSNAEHPISTPSPSPIFLR